MALGAAAVLGLVGAQAHRADGATQPRAASSASPGTFACVDRGARLTLVRGDGRARKTLKHKGEYPTFSPDGRRIAFRAVQHDVARNIAPKLLVSDRSGRNLHTVVSLPRSDSYGTPPRFEPLSWSSDSKQLAYVRETVLEVGPGEEPAAANRLFTADPSGGERAVPLHREGVPPSDAELALWQLDPFTAFSPDGATLAVAGYSFVDETSGRSTRGIWLVNAISGVAKLLLELPSPEPGARVFGLSWSPDGTQIAVYDSALVGPRSIRGFFIVDVVAAKATQGDYLIGDRWMRWAPDSRHIAVSGVANATRQARYDSRVADPGMSRVIDPSRRTPEGFEESNQLWSPDGRQIAFNRVFTGTAPRYKTAKEYERAAKRTQARSGVYVVPAAGGTPRRLIASRPGKPSFGDEKYQANELMCTDWSSR